VLTACAATAIWQEPRLWPAAHATMADTAATMASLLEDTDAVRGFFENLTGERTASSERTGYADRLAALFAR
jgi:hypothetical protein